MASSKLMLFIVNDILDLQQLSKGKLTLNVVSVSIPELMDETLGLFNIQS